MTEWRLIGIENEIYEGPYSCWQCERQSIIKDRGHTVESKVGKWKFAIMKIAWRPYKCAQCKKHSILVMEAIHLH